MRKDYNPTTKGCADKPAAAVYLPTSTPKACTAATEGMVQYEQGNLAVCDGKGNVRVIGHQLGTSANPVSRTYVVKVRLVTICPLGCVMQRVGGRWIP